MPEQTQRPRRRPGPRPGDFEARRQNRFFEIVDLSADLFARQGFSETNVAEIGEAAGLGRGALYHYIGSKGNVLAEIGKRFMEPLLNGLEVIVALDVSAPAKLRLASQSHLTIQARMLDHSRVIAREVQHLPPSEHEQFLASQRNYEAGWTTILQQGEASGDFVFENLSITRLAILSLHNYTMNWFQPSGALTPEQISQHYCGIVLGGIASGADPAGVEEEVAASLARLPA